MQKGAAMLKRLIILVVLLAGALVVGQAQDKPAREIYTALSYGDSVFEPESWLASATDQVGVTTAQWRADLLNGLAYLSYLHFDTPVQPDQISLIFTDDWFKATFANYQSVQEVTNCQLNDVTLHEFSLLQNNEKFSLRYWIKPISENRVLTMFLVFPSSSTKLLDDYAKKLFPDATVCAG